MYQPTYAQRVIAGALTLTAEEIAQVVNDLRRDFPLVAEAPVLSRFGDAIEKRYGLVGLEAHALNDVMFAGLRAERGEETA